jgi:hypothetical protein
MDERTIFELMNEQTEDMIYYFHIPSKKFIFQNKHAVDLTGIRKDEAELATAKDILLSIHPEDREKVKSAQANSLKPGCSQGEVEYRIGDYRAGQAKSHGEHKEDAGRRHCS